MGKAAPTHKLIGLECICFRFFSNFFLWICLTLFISPLIFRDDHEQSWAMWNETHNQNQLTSFSHNYLACRIWVIIKIYSYDLSHRDPHEFTIFFSYLLFDSYSNSFFLLRPLTYHFVPFIFFFIFFLIFFSLSASNAFIFLALITSVVVALYGIKKKVDNFFVRCPSGKNKNESSAYLSLSPYYEYIFIYLEVLLHWLTCLAKAMWLLSIQRLSHARTNSNAAHARRSSQPV